MTMPIRAGSDRAFMPALLRGTADGIKSATFAAPRQSRFLPGFRPVSPAGAPVRQAPCLLQGSRHPTRDGEFGGVCDETAYVLEVGRGTDRHDCGLGSGHRAIPAHDEMAR